MPALDSLSGDALTLPPEDRLTLARRLLLSVEPKPSAEIDAAWEKEIARRIADFDAGHVQTIPADSGFSRLREIAPDEW